MTNATSNTPNPTPNAETDGSLNHAAYHSSLMPPPKSAYGRIPSNLVPNRHPPHPPNQMGRALTDTPLPSAPGSPQM
jgi:hypothetical protein